MTKLTYVNRKTEGLKLGQIVHKDLVKRVHATEKALKKTPDTPPEPGTIELNLSGKNLADDGCREVMEGLQAVLGSQNGACSGRLEELNLTSNSLTATSLRHLATVIRLASYDLKDLDLSNNKIRVTTAEEVHDFEQFLNSFNDCRVLRRIDFSGNDLSGPLPFEIFARVYFRQSPVDPTELENLGSPDSDAGIDALASGTKAIDITRRDSGSPDSSMVAGTIIKRRRGLRSIPYIILTNVSMTDAGALFFSYVLAHHYFPQHLLPKMKAGPAQAQLDEYKHSSQSLGLVHLPNDSLSLWGTKMLEQAENVRQKTLRITDDITTPPSSYVQVNANQSTGGQRRRSSESTVVLDPGRRRASSISVASMKYNSSPDSSKQKSPGSELETRRRKLQRGTIDEIGQHSVQLWSAALKMLALARAIKHFQKTLTASHKSWAARLTGATPASDNVFGITDVSNRPARPLGSDFVKRTVTQCNGQTKKSMLLNRPAKIKEENPEHLWRLPTSVWRRIIAIRAGAIGVVSENQQRRIVEYALNRETLTVEREVTGKGDAAQIWTVLEAMGCLAYEMRM